MPVALITIPFSHFCEKARWALDRAQIRHTERPWLPLLHVPAAMRAGAGKRSTPILVTPHGSVQDSTEILRWVDRQLAEPDRLFPEGDTRAEVERLEERFDQTLGPSARRWGYSHLLDDRERLLAMMSIGVPAWQTATFRAGLPAIRALMKRGMGITPEKSARSLSRVEEVFGEVSALLADGRRYLTGDRFTAADLAFAALATPVLFPAEHERFFPSLADVPPAARPHVDQLRDTPAGRFGLRLYREERAKTVAR
jgi:glutathione S-transferase